MYTQIIYIIKNNCFSIFTHIFFAIINLKNVQSNFKTINLVLYNLEKIINNLDFKSHTFIPLNICSMNFVFINPNTFHTTKNAMQNFVNLNFKIVMH